ncbi:MAG: ketoacyl-ACP synthase III [Bacteroidetes bacterium]|nr:ketoacyl-ACP synthase III [Bacteroidota bacterium]
MALFNTHNVSIKGIAACVPKEKIRTADYPYFSEAEKDLFIKNVGIKERRVAPSNIATSDMCFFAAEKLIQKLQWNKDEISCLVFVSQSPDYFLPATSILLQHRLALNKNTMAFDVNLGCSGYIYGLQLLSTLVATGQIKKALLLVGDKSTLSTHIEDKSTYPLFGDAGSATAIEFDEKAHPIYFNLQSDGSGEDAIKILDGGARNSVRPDTFNIQEIEPGIKRSRRHLQLQGVDVFNFALREVAPNINQLLPFSHVEKEKIDFFVFHQANKLMNESVRKKLKIELEKTPYSIDEFGNTSSASIPLTMITRLKNQLENKKNTMLLSGFGVGYSWASCILTVNNPICCDLIEIE